MKVTEGSGEVLSKHEVLAVVQEPQAQAYFVRHPNGHKVLESLLACMLEDGKVRFKAVLGMLMPNKSDPGHSRSSRDLPNALRTLVRFRKGLEAAGIGFVCRATAARSVGSGRRYMWFERAETRVAETSAAAESIQDGFLSWFDIWRELMERVVSGEEALQGTDLVTLRVLLTFAIRLKLTNEQKRLVLDCLRDCASRSDGPVAAMMLSAIDKLMSRNDSLST